MTTPNSVRQVELRTHRIATGPDAISFRAGTARCTCGATATLDPADEAAYGRHEALSMAWMAHRRDVGAPSAVNGAYDRLGGDAWTRDNGGKRRAKA